MHPALGRIVIDVPRRMLVLGFVALIRLYQVLIRPNLAGNCCFHPTCSEYTIQALLVHGPLKGGWLGLRRIVRCRPFARGGYDAVPEPIV